MSHDLANDLPFESIDGPMPDKKGRLAGRRDARTIYILSVLDSLEVGKGKKVPAGIKLAEMVYLIKLAEKDSHGTKKFSLRLHGSYGLGWAPTAKGSSTLAAPAKGHDQRERAVWRVQ